LIDIHEPKQKFHGGAFGWTLRLDTSALNEYHMSVDRTHKNVFLSPMQAVVLSGDQNLGGMAQKTVTGRSNKKIGTQEQRTPNRS
jgi:hypothetical protein